MATKEMKQEWARNAELALIEVGKVLGTEPKSPFGKRHTIAAIAKHFKVTRAAADRWRKRIPKRRVVAIERLTRRKVLRQQMRPDLYPDVDKK